MPINRKHVERIKKERAARQATRAEAVRPGERVPQSRGNRIDGQRQASVNEQRATDKMATDRPLSNTDRLQNSIGGGVSLPNQKEAWPITEQRDRVGSKIYDSEPEPKYAKSGPFRGFFLKRWTKRARKWYDSRTKEKPAMSNTPTPQFNVTTMAGKGVKPLYSKQALVVVGLITAALSGWAGVEIAIDEATIDQAIIQATALWTAINTAIAAITWFYKAARNVYTEWGRIKTHGVKIHGENATFDFAPSEDSQS